MKKSNIIWFWLIITLLVLVGSYLILDREGLEMEENCYINSNGDKVCVSSAITCKNTSDGGKDCKNNDDVNSCSQYKNCDDCTKKCYWNDVDKKCGAFLDPGYSTKCDRPFIPPTTTNPITANPTTATNPITTTNPINVTNPVTTTSPASEPAPSNCSSLILLDGPVFIDPSAIPKKYRV